MAIEQLLLTQVLQITILASIVWLMTRTLARNHAHLAYVLWLVVLVKCVTPPIWSSPIGAFSRISPIDVSSLLGGRGDSMDSQVGQSSLHFVVDEGPETVWEHDHLAGAGSKLNDFVLEPEPSGSPTSEMSAEVPSAQPLSKLVLVPAAEDTSDFAHISSIGWLPAVWLGVAALTVLWTLSRAAFYVRALKAEVVDNEQLQAATDRLRDTLGLKRPARLLVTSCSVGPAVVGLFRPSIVVPQFIVERSTPEEMEPILAHELIHIRRGDLWVGLFRHFARSLWWFHPLVWKTSSSIRRGAERCCDEEVIASLGISPSEYARALLGVLELKQELRAVPVVPGVRPFDITSKRLERIMTLGHGSRQRTPRWCWAIALLLAAVSLPGAGLMLGEEEPQSAVNSLDKASSPADAKVLPAAQIMAAVPPAGLPTEPSVQVQCQILSGSAAAIDDLSIDWHAMSSRKPTKGQATHAFDSSVESQWGENHTIVERRFPIFYALLSHREAWAVIEKAQENANLNVAQSPVLRTRDGSPAQVRTGETREFVVGIDEEGKPELQQVHVGLAVQLRPSILKNGVRLAYQLIQTRIRAVDEMTVKTSKDAGFRIQIPELQTSTVTGANEVANNQTLIVRFQSDNESVPDEQMLAIIRSTPLIPQVSEARLNRASTATDLQMISWGLLQKSSSEDHILGPGDVLDVFIDGFSMDFPIPIRADGSIPLPAIEDPKIAGLTVLDAEKLISKAYKEDKKILRPDATIMLSLIRSKPIHVVVFREDRRQPDVSHDELRPQGNRTAIEPSRGFELELANAQADLLHVLAKSGGLPGKDVHEILVYRQGDAKPKRIAIRFAKGQQPKWTEDDITLQDGDIVVVGPMQTDSPAASPRSARNVGPATAIERNDLAPSALEHRSIGDDTVAPTKENLSGPLPLFDPYRLVTSESLRDQDLDEIDVDGLERWRLTLDECVSMSLQNPHVSKVLGVRVFGSNADPVETRLPLRNDGVTQNRIPIMLTRTNADFSFSDTEVNVRNYLLEVTQAYWNLHFHYHNLDAARTGFSNAHATWQQTKARAKNELEGGEAANEAQARAQYFSFKTRLEQAKQDLHHNEQKLRFLLGLAANDGRLIQPIDKPNKARMEFDWDEIRDEAMEKSPELQRQRGLVQQAEQELINAKIGQRSEITQVRNLELQLARAKKRLEDQELELAHQLSSARRRSKDAYRIAQTQLNRLVAYRDQLKSAATAYEIAQTVPLDVVLDAQSRRAQAEVDYFRAIVEYQLAIAELHFRKGSIGQTLGVVWSEEASTVQRSEHSTD